MALRRLLLPLIALALIAGACGSDGNDESASENSTTTSPVVAGPGPFDSPTVFCEKAAPPAGERNSNSPGVTANSVTFSDVSIDTAALKRLGVTGVLDFHDVNQFWVDKINECGGVNGRKIILKSAPYNPTTPTAAHFESVCLKATEDQEAFLAFGVGTSQGVTRCMITGQKVIYVAPLNPTESEFAAGEGRVVSRYPSQEALAEAFIADGVAQGTFEGKKITVIGADVGATNVVADQRRQFVDGFEEHGIDVELEILPCTGAVCTQGLGNAVRRLKSNGTNMIVLTGNLTSGAGVGTLFRELNDQNVNVPVTGPTYAATLADSSMAAVSSQAGTDGMAWVERNGWRTVGEDKLNDWRTGEVTATAFGDDCYDVWAEAKGAKPQTIVDSDYRSVVGSCLEMRLYARALYSLGNDVTTERMVAALKTVKPDKRDTGPTAIPTYFYSNTMTRSPRVLTEVVRYPCPAPVRDTTKGCVMPADTPIRFRTVKY